MPVLPNALFKALSPKPTGVTRVAVAIPPLVLVAPRIVTRSLSVSACGLAGEGKAGDLPPQFVGDDRRILLAIGRVDAIELRVRPLIDRRRIDDDRPVFREHRDRLRIGPGSGVRLVLGHQARGRQGDGRMVLRLRSRRDGDQQRNRGNRETGGRVERSCHAPNLGFLQRQSVAPNAGRLHPQKP